MQQNDSCLIINTLVAHETWCVYEHLMVMQDGQPPTVIYVNTCKLSDVYRLSQARQNSEWLKLTKINPTIMVRIIATGDNRHEMGRVATKHSRSFNPMPQCNLRGFRMRGGRGMINCSNGMQYRTQAEAALATGFTQSAISKCLRADVSHVGGLVFTYAESE